jgi:hypothetical protein
MITRIISPLVLRALAAAAALAGAAVAKAQLQIAVWVDTSSLVANPAGPFSLDFQLNDGSGVGDGNNWATLSNFRFGGGSAFGSGTTFGGTSGDLSTSVSLTDTDSLFNDFYQSFLPGSFLAFDLTLSNNVDAGGTPDLFSFAILDGDLLNLATQSLGSDTFLEINLTGRTPDIASFGSADLAISAPIAVPVPEPSAYALCGAIGLLGLIAVRRRKR